jgi:hypothetical protein
MEGLTLLEALCITKTGWTTEEERQLFDKASSIIEQEGKRLKLIYKKELIENELKQFKNK